MRENPLKRLWQQDKPAFGGWLTIGNSFTAEVMAHQGLDWLVVDLQHGIIDYETAVPMLQAISTTATTPIVRVPWNEPGVLMKVLDAGAYGVIVPLVNDRAQAEAAVQACRYPPLGSRSYGPARAVYYAGADYFQRANEEVLVIAQIETVEALDNLEEIVAVPGLDAVYIGPQDLTISLGLAPEMDGEAEEYVKARRRVVEACRAAGVVPGIHSRPDTAQTRIAEGFRMVLATMDLRALVRAAREDIETAKS
jgi:4-hydroxy-2-oxoheptanedioate aldolase